MVYDSPTFLPSTPRSRYNTLSTHSTLSEGSQMKPSDTVDQYKKVSLKQILKWNKNEWSFLFMGTVASLTAGAALPVVCVLFGHLFGVSLTKKTASGKNKHHDMTMNNLMTKQLLKQEK